MWVVHVNLLDILFRHTLTHLSSNKCHEPTECYFFQSKGGILAKACEYITSLRTSNARLGESLKDMEKLTVDVELLRQQCEELKQENALLRAQLQQHGLIPADVTGSSS